MSKQSITVVIIGLISIFLILYDMFALFVWGVDSTLSVVINEWAWSTSPLFVFMFGMIFGGLIVHFFKWKPNND